MISAEVALHKPEPEIYRQSAERLSVEPADCLFVDDLRENCEGAEAVGMTAILHRDAGETIARLAELTGVGARRSRSALASARDQPHPDECEDDAAPLDGREPLPEDEMGERDREGRVHRAPTATTGRIPFVEATANRALAMMSNIPIATSTGIAGGTPSIGGRRSGSPPPRRSRRRPERRGSPSPAGRGSHVDAGEEHPNPSPARIASPIERRATPPCSGCSS